VVAEVEPIRGLTPAEAAARAARGEVNRPPRSAPAEYAALVARNFFTLFNALVVPAAVALFLLKDYRSAWAVSAMALFNTLIALVQEIRAKVHLDRLALLAETTVRVVRNGSEVRVPAGEVVRGDVVRLTAGEPVVADGPVLDSNYLEVDEALLTGESDPVRRAVGEVILSGSFAVAGDGAYRAERVGGEAFATRTATASRRYRYAPGPVQRTLDTLIRILTAIAILLCGIYLLLHLFSSLPTTELVQMVAATVTSLVPQGLVLMTTVALTLGAVRLARKGAVAQRLAAVEAMASVDVVCTDKTGTLTTNNLAVEDMEIVGADADTVRAKLRVFAAATRDDSNRTAQALRAYLGRPDSDFILLEFTPFKSQTRSSAVRVRTVAGDQLFFLGSLDALRVRSEPAPPEWDRRADEWRAAGLRLLAFAEGQPAGPVDGPLQLCALIALRDELRPDAAEVLRSLSVEGVRFLVLSGDDPVTVRATVAHLNLPLADSPVRVGADFETAADPAGMLEQSSVFGRVTPAQKVGIVSTLQAKGHRVAMIGDGVNDILAVKAADLGVAMGAGSAATKRVAALVLENNRFDLLPAALAEGRLVVDNIRRAAKLFLLKNVYTIVVVVLLVGLLRDGFPYLPQQVTLLNALTIGGPALFLVSSKDTPHEVVRSAFLPEVARFVFGMGLPVGLAGVALWHSGDNLEEKRTLLLTFLIPTGLACAALVTAGDRRILAWAVVAIGVYVAVMYVPPVSYFFVLTPLPLGQWIAAVAVATGAVVVGWLLVR
jgi:cation-transporting ATPase E